MCVFKPQTVFFFYYNKFITNHKPQSKIMTKKISTLPTTYAKIADLGVEVSNNWGSKFSQIILTAYSPADLNNDAVVLKGFIAQSKLYNTNKGLNTQALKTVNKVINKEALKLRNCIKLGETNSDSLPVLYKSFGFQKTAKFYVFPADNTTRKQSIVDLLMALQTTSNTQVLAGADVREWLSLQAEHLQQWTISNQLRSSRKTLTTQINEMVVKIKKKLILLHQVVAIQFDKSDVASIWRELGFLKESI
jgi:DUF438 domain-containing protein